MPGGCVHPARVNRTGLRSTGLSAKGRLRADVIGESQGKDTYMVHKADGLPAGSGGPPGGAGAPPGTSAAVTRGQRWLARLAFGFALAAGGGLLPSRGVERDTAPLLGSGGPA